jgi:hypothetical protein
MYPLNLQLPAPLIGFACANNEQEHKELSEAGFLPAFGKVKKTKKLEEN